MLLAAALSSFAVILLGQAIAQRRFVPWETWSALQFINYYLFLPALFFYGLATVSFDGFKVGGLALGVIATMLIGALLLTLWRWRRGVDQAQTPALLEAVVRANMPLGFALALALFGPTGIQLLAIVGLIYLPMAVALGAYVTQASGPVGEGRWTRLGFLTQSVRILRLHPIFLGAALGLALNVIGEKVNPALLRSIQTFAYAGIAIGILSAGAAVNTRTLRAVMGSQPRALAIVTLLKLVILPLVAAALCWVLGLQGVTAKVVVLLAALPCVAPRFSVGTPLGRAPPVLNAAASANTLLWVVTLPLVLWILT